MSKPQDRIVHKSGTGLTNVRVGAKRAERMYPKQDEAVQAACENLKNAGEGELTIQGRDGRFRDKNTNTPGKDPRVQYMPAALEPRLLYVSEKFDIAIPLCACGCGFRVKTPLGPTEWSIEETAEGPTVRPSIGNWQQSRASHTTSFTVVK